MASDLPKTYDPKQVERKWYQFWEESGHFQADTESKKPSFCIVIPPPNVTGALHMGHALGDTLQDILIRWKRMLGFEALWVPGTDHAGIATQTVVERHLMNTQGKRRKDFSREEFLQHVWNWKEENESRIVNQLKQLGCSCDWNRLRFTMDDGNNRAVRKMFKMLFDDGLIYRGDYLVNWDPVTQTALADDEVEYEDRQGSLWYFKYPFSDGSGYAHIATTRPETMLGDTAVAVSPKDKRFAHLEGKMIRLPLMDREIPIILDRHVDPEFGTGMVKVTPAHDPNDYEMGIAHNLPFINIMTPDAKINENGGTFTGMTMEDARDAVVKEMDALGLLEKVEPHSNRVGVSYRSKAKIEPYLSKQWFVRMDKFAGTLRELVQEEEVRLVPKNWENTYFHWIDNLRDWCISRQLWWGHRIPIWYHKVESDRMICFAGDGIPPEVASEPDMWEQDEDVLDTWFSSQLWPFAALGWPENTPELKKFYPNSVLVTGHDILFFWVARMLLAGNYALQKPPFPVTVIHGLIFGKSYWRQKESGGIQYVSDEERLEYDLGKPLPNDVQFKWEKMSKSKGNIINPLEVIDQYGTDAMRMALCSSATQSWEIDLDRRKFEDFKNFANKMWNGARFIFMNLDGDDPLTSEQFSEGLNESLLALEDRWILSISNRMIRDVNEALENYSFDQAATEAYDFFWKEFCSYYLEIVKPVLFGKIGSPQERKNKQKLLVILLCQAIRLLHPMAPFITEELFQRLKERLTGVTVSDVDHYTRDAAQALQSNACMISPYPQIIRESDMDPEIDRAFSLIGRIVYTVRNIRGEMKVPPSTPVAIHLVVDQKDPAFETLQKNCNIIEALVKTTGIELHSMEPEIGFSSTGMIDGVKVIIPLPDDLLHKEQGRLEKERVKLEKNLQQISEQLSNDEFVAKAPLELIEKKRTQMEQIKEQFKEISHKLALLK